MRISRHATVVAIILLACLVFFADGTRKTDFAGDFGTVPALVSQACRELLHGQCDGSTARDLSRTISSLFVHGDGEHILYNMVFLWAFGYLASQHLGQWWALAVFLVTGVCGNLVQVYLDGSSMIPIIGASGAVCGFEGVYFGLTLRWQLPDPDVWPLAHPIPPLQLAAFALVGFMVDVYFLTDHSQGIAFGAHIGGFLSGLAIAAVVTTIYPTTAAYQRAGRRK